MYRANSTMIARQMGISSVTRNKRSRHLGSGLRMQIVSSTIDWEL